MADEHQSGGLPDFAFLDRAHPDLLNLRGHFTAPQEQGQIHSLYRILHVFRVGSSDRSAGTRFGYQG
jgi:hypothetical protein